MSEPIYLAAAVVGVLIIVQITSSWLFLRGRTAAPYVAEAGGVAVLQRQIESLERSLDSRMNESSQAVQRSMTESTRLITQITADVTSVREIGRETGKFAEQLKSFQDLFRNPKQRGVLGEYLLETVLRNVFPPDAKHYRMQYAFTNKETVDAAIFIGEKIVPVDSKFSLENYNRFVEASDDTARAAHEREFIRDLRLRIEETAKYIRPSEGTMDFAFMYIPSEGIYYDLLTNRVGGGAENLIQRAAAKKVIIVSPTSLLAYLQTVMQGLRALQIEQRAQEIEARVAELGKHMGAYQDSYRRLGNALGTTVEHYKAGAKELGKIDKDVLRITGEKFGADIPLPDRPSDD